MNKKTYLMLGVGVVVIVAVIIVLASMKQTTTTTGKVKSNTPAVNAPEEGIVTNTGEVIADIKSPGKAVDSGQVSPEQLQDIPLSAESFIKYGVNGLEATIIKAKAGERVFLTFSASDDKQHLFAFSDPKMESIFVMFSKKEGDKSINFLSPGVGSYDFTIDGKDKGVLIIE